MGLIVSLFPHIYIYIYYKHSYRGIFPLVIQGVAKTNNPTCGAYHRGHVCCWIVPRIRPKFMIYIYIYIMDYI